MILQTIYCWNEKAAFLFDSMAYIAVRRKRLQRTLSVVDEGCPSLKCHTSHFVNKDIEVDTADVNF